MELNWNYSRNSDTVLLNITTDSESLKEEARLRKRIRELEEEIDILKRFTKYLSKGLQKMTLFSKEHSITIAIE